MANYNVEMNRFNGADYDGLLPRNSIYGSTNPTDTTAGIIGQFYININTGNSFVCTNVGAGKYNWVQAVLTSNKNLLDNWDFRNLVNQRGVTSWTGGNYGIDRWRAWNTNAVVTSNGIQISQNGLIEQSVENPSLYIGKIMTFSVIIDNTLHFVTGVVGTSNVIAIFGDVAIDFYINTYNHFVCRIFGIDASSGTHIIKCAKLEVGLVSTLVNDPPANYAEELAKCQRYFVAFDSTSMLHGALFMGNVIIDTATTGQGYIKLPVPMRAKPVLVFGTLGIYNGLNNVSITGFAVLGISAGLLGFDFTTTDTMSTVDRNGVVYCSALTGLSADL